MSLSPLPLSRRCLHSCRPAEEHELMARLTNIVCACKGIAEHRLNSGATCQRVWGNIMATRVGVIAHEIIRTARSAETGQILH